MRKYSFFLPLVLIACAGNEASSHNQDITPSDSIHDLQLNEERLSAVDFNNEMTLMQESILDQVDALFQSDSSTIDVNLENTLFEIELDMESLSAMKYPKSAESFVMAMQKLLQFYQQEFTGPFSEIVSLLKKSEWTKADEKKVDEYDLNFVTNEKAWFDTVLVEQEKFAQKNNIKLEVE